MFKKHGLVGALLALAATSPLLLSGTAHAAPEGEARPAALVCGYNDNDGHGNAVWRNCGNFHHLIKTTTWFGSESYQCVAAYTNYHLGATWFIDNSVYADGVGCRP
ncbi:hypothetical protein ACWFRJ_00765 [Streptomyces sp. NPDC055239]